MSELVDRVGGDTIQSTFHNQVKERTMMRYSSAGARDASIPVPVAGSLAWLQDVDAVTVYDGASWATIWPMPTPRSVLVGNLTLTAGTGVNQLVAQITSLDTLNWRYLFSASGNIESALGGSVTVTWKLAVRMLAPPSTVHEVDTRNYLEDSAYRGVLAVTGLSPLPGDVNNGVEVVIQRDNTNGTQILKDLSLTAVAVASI